MKFERNNFHLDNENLHANKKNFLITLIAFSFLAITVSTSSFGSFDNNPTRSMNVFAQTQEPGNNNITDNNPLALSTLIKQGSPYYGNENAPYNDY
jgi:hypothetical protein